MNVEERINLYLVNLARMSNALDVVDMRMDEGGYLSGY